MFHIFHIRLNRSSHVLSGNLRNIRDLTGRANTDIIFVTELGKRNMALHLQLLEYIYISRKLCLDTYITISIAPHNCTVSQWSRYDRASCACVAHASACVIPVTDTAVGSSSLTRSGHVQKASGFSTK
jgi:hypothetical protein